MYLQFVSTTTAAPEGVARHTTYSNKEGRFTFDQIEPGRYYLGMNTLYPPNAERPYAPRFYPNAGTPTEAYLIDVGDGEQKTDFDFTLLPLSDSEIAAAQARPADSPPVKARPLFSPQLLPEQTVALKVGSITAQAIELLWLEARPEGLPPRKLTIPVDLRPYVRYQLKGVPTDKNQWEKKNSKEEETTVPVGRVFPNVSDAAHMAALQAAQRLSAPRPAPVTGPTPLAELPAAATEVNLLLPPTNGETLVNPEAPK